MNELSLTIRSFLDAREGQNPGLLGLCDIAYSRRLIGLPVFSSDQNFGVFMADLANRRLAGTDDPNGESTNVHLTAYALGVLNLVAEERGNEVRNFLRQRQWNWRDLFHDDLTPRWPSKYTHHSWRVSHWIGGSVSIAQSLWTQVPEVCAAMGLAPMDDLLQACDRLIAPQTGLLKTYKSDAIQFVFRNLYRIRHDPDAGEVGGIVHLHWVNYARDRLPYKSSTALWDKSWKLMQKAPFMESVPYCLDFDIVQIVRTGDPVRSKDHHVQNRARQYASDISTFLSINLGESYGLHKLPGALATLHECAFITESDTVEALDLSPVDIIKEAYWL